jgi:hypothetical protein
MCIKSSFALSAAAFVAASIVSDSTNPSKLSAGDNFVGDYSWN